MEHDPEIHVKNLQKLCRICRGIALTYRDKQRGCTTYKCTQYGLRIYNTFGIKTSTDDEQTHPTDMCHKCYKLLERTEKQESVEAIERLKSRLIIPNWTPFQPSIDTSACDVCGHYADLLRGGRRKSKKSATTGTDPSRTDAHFPTSHPHAQGGPGGRSSVSQS